MASALNDWLERQWADRPKHFTVKVDGCAIACHGWNLAASHLPGIVLVHGFRAHAHWWDHIAPSLADRFRVVALSLSGMGDSGSRDHYSHRQFSREILGVAMACEFDPAIVIAHSFGAGSALVAASDAPDHISRLIVIDCAIRTGDESVDAMQTRPRRVYPTREAALERFRLIPEGPWPELHVRDYIARNSVRQDPDGWTWKFDHLLTNSLNADPHRRHLPPVAVPVDVILGELTSIMLPPHLAELSRIASNMGCPVVIPASEHHVMIDQPIALVSALRALLMTGLDGQSTPG